LAKPYKDLKTGKRFEKTYTHSLIGTARYASIPAHEGVEQAPRDDLESMCYIMLYLLRGGLPWEGVLADNTQEKYDIIRQVKIKRTSEILCKGLPGMIL